jgi:hypothetical protein
MPALVRSDTDDGVHALMAEIPVPRKYIVAVDSGATDHCFWRREDFVEYHPVESREGNAAAGSKFRILATGKVRKAFTHHGVQRFVTFDGLHTPDFTINLISVSRLDEKGFSVEFKKGKAVFKTSEGSPFMEGVLVDGMYRVDFDSAGVAAATARSRDSPASRGMWHRRLGHIGFSGLDDLVSGEHVNGLNVNGGFDGLCEDCL